MAEAGSEGALPRAAVTRATLVLVLLRVAYAYNWFDIGPGVPARRPPSRWTRTWASSWQRSSREPGCSRFRAGSSPARYGTREHLAPGCLGAGAALASAASPTFGALVAIWFAAGAGAGLFFSPAIALVGSLHAPGGAGRSRRSVQFGVQRRGRARRFRFRAPNPLGRMAGSLAVEGWPAGAPRGRRGGDPLEAGGPGRRARPGTVVAPGGVLRSRAVWRSASRSSASKEPPSRPARYFVPFAERSGGGAGAGRRGRRCLCLFRASSAVHRGSAHGAAAPPEPRWCW